MLWLEFIRKGRSLGQCHSGSVRDAYKRAQAACKSSMVILHMVAKKPDSLSSYMQNRRTCPVCSQGLLFYSSRYFLHGTDSHLNHQSD